MDRIEEIVYRTKVQLKETALDMLPALSSHQHSTALGHLTDAYIIFSSGLREIIEVVSETESEDIAIEIADEALSDANVFLNKMSDVVSGYMDDLYLVLSSIRTNEDFHQNPVTW